MRPLTLLSLKAIYTVIIDPEEPFVTRCTTRKRRLLLLIRCQIRTHCTPFSSFPAHHVGTRLLHSLFHLFLYGDVASYLGHSLLPWYWYCLMAASASSPSPIRATQHLAGQKQPSSMYYKPSLAPQIKHGSSASSPRKIITVSPPSSATNSFVSLSPPQQSINDHDNRQPENLPLQANWTHHGNTTNGNSTSITQSGSYIAMSGAVIRDLDVV